MGIGKVTQVTCIAISRAFDLPVVEAPRTGWGIIIFEFGKAKREPGSPCGQCAPGG